MKSVASIAVVNRRKAILYICRTDNHKWTLPGGHLNEGEKPLDGAVRELLEETGIKAPKKDLEYIGSGTVDDKYLVHSFVYPEPKGGVEVDFSGDPDEEADEHCWFGEDSDSDYASDIPDNTHVPNELNVTLALMGRTTPSDKLKLERPVKKMAIKDLPPGEKIEDDWGHEAHDYSHLLPSKWKDKLSLRVYQPHHNEYVLAQLHDNSGEEHSYSPDVTRKSQIGHVKADVNDGVSITPHSELHEDFHGEGLGKAMYEALYAHAYHNMGIRQVEGGNHSNDAGRVHESLARAHGLNYVPKGRPSIYGLERKPYKYNMDGIEQNPVKIHKAQHEAGSPSDDGAFFDVKPHSAMEQAVQALSNDLRKPKYQNSPNPLTGHCYVASEALYHMLGGNDAGWVPHHVKHEGEPHWYLKHRNTGAILDPTAGQFKTPVPYDKGRGKGFLTKEPSKRAKELISRIHAGLAAKNDPTLKKGVLGAVAGAALAITPGLKAAFDKVNPPPAPEKTIQAQPAPQPEAGPLEVAPEPPKPAKWTPDGLHASLIPIAHLESSFGQNMNHAPNAKGDYHTAFGPVGFKVNTAHEEWTKSNQLKKLYPGLEDPKAFTDKFKNDWKFYNLLATSHFLRLTHRHGSPEKAAYAWRYGSTAAQGADDSIIAKEPYVMRYRDMAASAGIKKSERMAKDWKSSDGIVIPHHTNKAARKAWDKKFHAQLVEHFGYGNAARLKPIKLPVAQATGGNMPVNKSRYSLYTKMAQAGDPLPPVVVRRNGLGYNLLDGNHRQAAAQKAGLTHLNAYELVDPVTTKL